jgi:serine protease Do
MRNPISQSRVAVGPNKRLIAYAVAAALTVVVIAVPLLSPALAKQTPPAAANLASTGQLPGSFADIVAAVRPAVVNISTSGIAKNINAPQFRGPPNPQLDEFFKRFFPDRFDPRHGMPRHHEARALGSGFIIDSEGYVVTNNHVIDGADEITVILDDGREFPATLQGRDPKTDLAVLKIDADQALPYVQFGDSEGARVGDWVIAIGNPFGLGGSTSTGIISARGRDINAGPLDDFIQIDAPINRGNSGGPLFDTSGKVIGVNTAIFSPNGGNVGIGFAIPASMAANVVEQIKQGGIVQRGWLGVQIQSVTDELADALGMDTARGALVSSVIPDSPAAAAGIRQGDVIVRFDDGDVTRMRDLPRLVAATNPAHRVSVEVWRAGTIHELSAVIEASAEESEPLAATDRGRHAETPAKLGVAVSAVTPTLRAQFGLAEEVTGVVITAVDPAGPAAQQGLRPGDVIVMIGQQKVSSAQQVADALDAYSDKQKAAVPLLIHRDGNDRFVAIRIA